MKLQVFTVFDSAVKAYLQPFFVRSVGEALRSFTELVNDGQSNVSKHPADFHLYKLGEYDDVAGLFETGLPVRVASAVELIKDDNIVLPLKEARSA